MQNFENKKYLIYGFGISGRSCFKYLKKKNCSIKIYDDNLKLYKTYNKYKIKKNNIPRFRFDFVVISPGIHLKNCSLKNYLKKNKNKIINELDLFYQNYETNKKITITGTNGKSTTAKLVYEIFKYCKKDVRLVGNIGKPLLNQKNIKKHTIFIIEASSYQIDYYKNFKTDIAVILNLSPDHLDRHKTFSNYANTKFKLIKSMKPNGIAIIKKNAKILTNLIKKNKIKSKIFKIDDEIDKKFELKITNKLFYNLNNKLNLKFALEICKIFNLKKIKFIKAINSFKTLPYRQQILLDNSKLFIMNDSKSTSFSSTIENLKSYKNIYWIVGGVAKKGDKLQLDLKYRKNIKAYLYGVDKIFFSKQLQNKIYFKKFENLSQTLKHIMLDMRNDNKKKYLIFSPSGASFDQFKNFEARGKYFNLLLNKLKFVNQINDNK